jgi:hypothetical protein
MRYVLMGHGSEHRRLVYEHSDGCDSRELNEVPNDYHDQYILRGIDGCRDRPHCWDDCAHHDRLVFGDNEGMGSGDLVDNKHATSEDSSDAFLHADHHYGGDEKSHCGDGVDWHGEPQRYGRFRDGLQHDGKQQ